MTYEGRVDVELKGCQLEAVEIALRQFRLGQFSTTGDLKHFTIELRRRSGKLAASFFPNTTSAGTRGLRGRGDHAFEMFRSG